MSEEGIHVLSSPEKVEDSENGAIQKDDDPKPALHSDESSTEKVEEVDGRGNRQPTEPAQPEDQNRPVLGSAEAVDSNLSEMQPGTPDASDETKSSERTSDADQPTAESISSDVFTEAKSPKKTGDANQPATKSTSSDGMSPSKATSGKGLEEVTENIQLIYKGLKDMKISGQEAQIPTSGKKGRKAPSTPRAKSTPAYLTSPPLTRSRSRDLKKCPTTPASPNRSGSRNSGSESEEVKGARGRQRVKKN